MGRSPDFITGYLILVTGNTILITVTGFLIYCTVKLIKEQGISLFD